MQDTKRLTILFTNDQHGHFLCNKNKEGGTPAQYTLINSIRKEVRAGHNFVLLLSGGDVNSGTPESDLSNAYPDIFSMNYTGYDAMAVGNHEFDKPFDSVLKQQKWADFPFISSNIFYKGTDNYAFTPYIIKDFNRLKVAIFGLTPDRADELSIDFPKDILEIRPALEIAVDLVPKLSRQADIVIGLSHIGFYNRKKDNALPKGDILLASKAPGIDIIIGSHTHTRLFEPVIENKTIICQAGENGLYLGRLDVIYRSKKLYLQNYRLYTINHIKAKKIRIKEERPLNNFLTIFKTTLDELLSEKLGYSSGYFDGNRDSIRNKETNLGRLVTYLMKIYTKADLAVISSGLIRQSLHKGVVTFRDVYMIHPFQLTYCTVILSGKELKAYILKIAEIKPGTGRYPQMSDFHIEYKSGSIIDIKIKTGQNFKCIINDKKYILAVTKFNAKGGDGYPVLNIHPTYRETQLCDIRVMEDFLRTKKIINPEDF